MIEHVGLPMDADTYLSFKSEDGSLEGIIGAEASDAAFVIIAYAESLEAATKHYLLQSDAVIKSLLILILLQGNTIC